MVKKARRKRPAKAHVSPTVRGSRAEPAAVASVMDLLRHLGDDVPFVWPDGENVTMDAFELEYDTLRGVQVRIMADPR